MVCIFVSVFRLTVTFPKDRSAFCAGHRKWFEQAFSIFDMSLGHASNPWRILAKVVGWSTAWNSFWIEQDKVLYLIALNLCSCFLFCWEHNEGMRHEVQSVVPRGPRPDIGLKEVACRRDNFLADPY